MAGLFLQNPSLRVLIGLTLAKDRVMLDSLFSLEEIGLTGKSHGPDGFTWATFRTTGLVGNTISGGVF